MYIKNLYIISSVHVIYIITESVTQKPHSVLHLCADWLSSDY